MDTRITTSGGRSGLQLVEGHRDAQGKVRIRVVANLGRLDRLSPAKLDPLIGGLNRAVGRLENTADEITHEPARAFGDVFALHELWQESGFDPLWGVRCGRASANSTSRRRHCSPELPIAALVFRV